MIKGTKQKIRILVAKLGLDAHDRGAVLLCQLLRDGWYGSDLHRCFPNS